MATLHISLLGSFQVSIGDQPVTLFESDKVRALLAYLVVEENQSHRRESLAALLWPNMPETTARSNLRHSLTNLRKAICDYEAQPPFLHITRQTLQFNCASQHTLDVANFLSAIDGQTTITQLETAVTLYRGDFLSGFSVAGTVAFEEWATVKREQYHRGMGNVLSRLAELYTQRSQYDQALVYVQRQVELEPWDETAHQQLMRLLALNGKRSAAVAQYQKCCQILQAELGIEPTAVTTTLYQNIRDESWPNKSAFLPPPRFVKEAPPITPSIFVARDRELTQLKRFLNRACTGRSQIAFITGEAGSGKTSLMQAFAQQAMESYPDLLVVGGQCSAYTGSSNPYRPFLEMLNMFTSDIESRWEAGDISTNHARRLWSALPEVMETIVNNGRILLTHFISSRSLLSRAQIRTRNKSPDQIPWLADLAQCVNGEEKGDPIPQLDLFAQFTQLVSTLATRQPLLLLLDDLQWADSGSLNLLLHLGQQLRSSRIFILGAYRPADVAANHAHEPHPLTGVINNFQQIFGPNRIDLQHVAGRPFIDALLDSEPNRLDETFRQTLLKHTSGHALFTTELLRGLQERGDLVKDTAGNWIESATLDWDILPAVLEAAIAGRISRLPDSLHAMLTIASIEGETFTAELIAQIQHTSEQETVHKLSGELSRQHRMVLAQSSQRLGKQRLSRYRFHHFLFQKYLYNDLDPVERANLHEAVGDTLEKLYEEQETAVSTHFGQLAWHFQEAHVPEKAITYYQKAGERAWQLSASDEAIAYHQKGLELLETIPDSPERKQQELHLQMSLAMPLQATKGFAAPEVRQTYDRAYLLCQQVGQTEQLFSILGFLGSYYLTSGQYRTSLKIAQQLLELGQQFQNDLQIILAYLGLSANLIQLGKLTQSHEHLEQINSFYDHHKHHAITPHYGIDPGVNSLLWATLVTWVLGYPDQARQHSQDAIELAQILDHPFSLTAALEVSGGILHILCREYQAASDKITASLQLADTQNFRLLQIEGKFYQGFLHVVNGNTEEGIAQMQQSLAGWQATGMRILYSQMLGLLAEALGMCGQFEKGLHTLDKAFNEVHTRNERFFISELHRIKGDLLWGCGKAMPALAERETAVIESTYHQAITIARHQNAKSWELRAALRLAQFWQAHGKIAGAYSLLSQTYNWFTEGFETPDLLNAKTMLEQLKTRQ